MLVNLIKGILMSIKKVGDTNIEQKHRLSCHCGSVVLELHLPNGIVNPRRCDCSICRRKGAVVSSVSLEDITVIKGLEHLRFYQFNTKVAKHYFVEYAVSTHTISDVHYQINTVTTLVV